MQSQSKILTAITIPTGGYQLRFVVSAAGTLDTSLTITIAAGTYYISWDNQSDDLLLELATRMNVAIAASALSVRGVLIDLDATHKVRIGFDNNYFKTNFKRDVKIEWGALDGITIAGILGFNAITTTITGVDNPVFTGSYQHAYGWYADEDGLLRDDKTEDVDTPTAFQSKTPSGHVKTHFVDSSFSNILGLQFLPKLKTFSRDKGYTEASVYPYARNVPLQCWWKEARQGIRFRVYRDGSNQDFALASERGEATGGTTTKLIDTNKLWGTEPKIWANRALLIVEDWADNTEQNMRWLITSNTATELAVGNAEPSGLNVNNDPTYAIFEQAYGTYWLDLNAVKEFEPIEIPNIDRYNFLLELLRFEA